MDPLAIALETSNSPAGYRECCSIFRASVFYDDSGFSIPRRELLCLGCFVGGVRMLAV
jgi:hypothetical protein